MSNFGLPDELTQTPFDDVEFAENPEPRCPCVLLLDTSYSMTGQPIAELNLGLRAFRDALMKDAMAVKRVELAIVSFGPVRVAQSFVSVDRFTPPTFVAENDTPMGEAILEGARLIEERKASYKAHGVAYYRPWMILITDGAPTDDWERAVRVVAQGEADRKLAFFPIGVEGADMTILGRIATRRPLKLKGLAFTELFQWLSSSLSEVSHSQPDAQKLALPPPEGWAEL